MNIKVRVKFLLIVLILTIPVPLCAAENSKKNEPLVVFPKEKSCVDVIKVVYEDVIKKEDPKNKNYQANFMWKDLTWLKNNLGEPDDSKVIEETLYSWNNYQVLMRGEQLIQIKGTYPGSLPLPDNLSGLVFVETLIGQIGEPKNILVGKIKKYAWACKDDKNSLNVLVDEKGTVIEVMGTYCGVDNCYQFRTNGDPSVTMLKMQ